MNWYQTHITLPARPYGIHVITPEIVAGVPEIARYRIGLAHIFIHHTSASLALNESVEPEVRTDLRNFLDVLVPEGGSYTHSYEGPDDMPAHIKSVLTGSSVLIPISDGRLNLGTWQGVYLCEHRRRASSRHLVITLLGEHN